MTTTFVRKASQCSSERASQPVNLETETKLVGSDFVSQIEGQKRAPRLRTNQTEQRQSKAAISFKLRRPFLCLRVGFFACTCGPLRGILPIVQDNRSSGGSRYAAPLALASGTIDRRPLRGPRALACEYLRRTLCGGRWLTIPPFDILAPRCESSPVRSHCSLLHQYSKNS